jgi:O-antigen/teichoic acid export membrane protein
MDGFSTSKIVSASKWSTLAQVSARVMTPLIFVVVARLLTPSDYGVFAMAGFVIAFASVFWTAGLTKTLIQKHDDINSSANICFWTNLIIALFLYAIIFVSSRSIAIVFKDIRIEEVLKVTSLVIIISSMCSVQSALFQKVLNFKILFWTTIITTGLPAFASIPLAYHGYGYWALVIGQIIGNIAQLIVLWVSSDWRPGFEYNIAIAKEMFSFSAWVMGEDILVYINTWIDSIILGIYLGAYDLGLYRTGTQLVILIFGVLIQPVLPVLYSSFARIKEDKAKVKNMMLKATKIIVLYTLPASLGLYIVAKPISSIILGPKWHGVEAVIAICAIASCLTSLITANSEAYRATGRPEVNTKLQLISLIVCLPCYIWAGSHGLHTFLITRLFVAALILFAQLYFTYAYLDISPVELFLFLKWILLASGAMVLGLFIENKIYVSSNAILELLLTVSSGIIIFLLAMLPEEEFIKQVWSTFAIIPIGKKRMDQEVLTEN